MRLNPQKLVIIGLFGLMPLSCAEIKQAGRDIGHGTRDLTRAIGHGTRDVAKSIGHGARDAAKEIKKVSKGSKKSGKPSQ